MLTGKGLTYGGSLARTEATGYGLCYFTEEMLNDTGQEHSTARPSSSPAPATLPYTLPKRRRSSAQRSLRFPTPTATSTIHDGIKLDAVKQIKEVERARIKEYVDMYPNATYTEGCHGIWGIKCDIALPCATQNELDEEGAKKLIANGVIAVSEGANMPSTPEAIAAFQEAGILFGPAKAANAGGVATSALEMSPELPEILLDVRRGRRKTARDHGEHLPQRGKSRRKVRHEG